MLVCLLILIYNNPMPESLTNPHDRFFKDLFTRQEAAQDFLHHYLPSELVALLDLSDLQISKDSFVDPDLQEHFSDLLYQVSLKGGQETSIFVLFEHKSYPDPLIALQLLRYMVRIWEQALKQQKPLLPIVPMVVYHGQQKWQVALDFAALFNLPEVMKPYIPDYRYWLCDLNQYSDEQIEGHLILQTGLLLLKYIKDDDIADRLADILSELSKQETTSKYLYTIMRYVAAATDKVSEEQLRETVTNLFSQGEKLMPTLVEQWLERGRVEGRKKGREEGRQEGRQEGRKKGRQEGRKKGREAAVSLLRRFLKHRFNTALDHFDPAFTPLDLGAITRLSDAAFEVNTLSEFEAVLAGLQTEQKDETGQLSTDN